MLLTVERTAQTKEGIHVLHVSVSLATRVDDDSCQPYRPREITADKGTNRCRSNKEGGRGHPGNVSNHFLCFSASLLIFTTFSTPSSRFRNKQIMRHFEKKKTNGVGDVGCEKVKGQ